MEHTHAMKFKIQVVKWSWNLVKLRDRRQSGGDDDEDHDDVIF
jgi:hypothetical protein